MSKKQKGFTLIELIVTIVIIGILAAVAMPKMGNSVEAAAKAADTATATAFESGIAMAMADLASDPARRANPYPTLVELPDYVKVKITDGSGNLVVAEPSTSKAGLCLGDERMLPTFTDEGLTTATAADDDVVKSVGSTVIAVANTECPPAP